MNRRYFLSSLAAAEPASLITHAAAAEGQTPQPSKSGRCPLPTGRITSVRIVRRPQPNRLFNQSNMLCTVETDMGITGIGEGGSKDTLEQCAGTHIGKDPFKIEAIWQEMFIAWFYPPGREKIHA